MSQRAIPDTEPMPFRYLRDPLFLCVFAIYAAHCLAKRLEVSPWWLRFYLNDVICIPFWIPILLWASRRLRLRIHDCPPQPLEIVLPLLVWSAVFEVWLPTTSLWRDKAFADPFDVTAYALGAWLAYRFWNWWYRSEGEGEGAAAVV
jgi:hypothetical protein